MPPFFIYTFEMDLLSDPTYIGYNYVRNKTPDVQFAKILEVFAFGTLDDYYNHQDELVPLTDQQVLKLRQLTLISLCQGRTAVPFDEIRSQLHVDDVIGSLVQLGDSDLVKFRIDEVLQEIEVDSVASRDVFVRGDKPLAVLDSAPTLKEVISKLREFRDGRIDGVRKELVQPTRKRPLES